MDKYIIVGKGASGKDWMQSKMVEKGYRPMKQYTTRPIRDNENGDEYVFMSEEEFLSDKEKGEFTSSNFYRIGWYGVKFMDLFRSSVAILSPANLKDINEKYPWFRKLFTIIYLDIPVDIRRERLLNRYGSKIDDDNEKRIEADEEDFKDFSFFDIRLTTENDVNNYINMLSPAKKVKEDEKKIWFENLQKVLNEIENLKK